MGKIEKRIKLGATALCELFVLFTVIKVLTGGPADKVALAFGTILLVLSPLLLEKITHCKVNLAVYLFATIYALGPILGNCWKLYYTFSLWDKLLHASGGVMFAILGVYFFELLMHGKENHTVKILFALLFSLALAMLWEFVEFGADTFLGVNMQGDWIISNLNSYLLGDGIGITGSIENIQTVTVNGIALPGYIDIGLIDTMLDMLLETAGAIITCVALWLDKGKHPLIIKTTEK